MNHAPASDDVLSAAPLAARTGSRRGAIGPFLRNGLLVSLLLVCLLAASAPVEAVEVSGLAVATAARTSTRRWVYQRRDFSSPYDPLQARLMVDTEIDPNTQLFLEFETPIGEGFKVHGASITLKSLGRSGVRLEVGKIPTVFGIYQKRALPSLNPLAGDPLAYSYFTRLWSDRPFASGAALVAAKPKGSWVGYHAPAPLRQAVRTTPGKDAAWDGSLLRQAGQPTVYEHGWDTGLALSKQWKRTGLALGLMNGSLSNPKDRNDLGSTNVVGRFEYRHGPTWRFTLSGATGNYLDRAAETLVPAGRALTDYKQGVYGGGVEYALGAFDMNMEYIRSRWDLPVVEQTVGDRALYWTGRYKIRPGLFTALRFDRIRFDAIAGAGGVLSPWYFDADRTELGFGYYLSRRNLLKTSVASTRFPENAPWNETVTSASLVTSF